MKQSVVEAVNRGGADDSSLLQRTRGKGEKKKRGESQSGPGGRNKVWRDPVWKELKRSCLLKLEYSLIDPECACFLHGAPVNPEGRIETWEI